MALAIADPLVAGAGDQYPGEQVIRQAAFRARDRFAHVTVFQRVQQGLGGGVGDQRFVRVALDLPLGAQLALDPADVAMAWRPFVVDVPYCVPGVGERVPFHADQGGVRPGDGQVAAQLRARDAGGAADQVARDERGVIARLQFRLGDGSAFPHGAGTGVHQAVTTRCAAAGAETLAHVFGHTGEAFLFRCDRMHDGEGVHHRVHHDLADGVELGQVAEDNLDALLGAFIAEHMPDIRLARQSTVVEDQQHIPGAAAAADVGDQLLEGGAVFGFRGFDDVAVLLHDEQLALTRGSLEISALRVGADVVTVFARSNVQCRFFHGSLPGRVSGTARIAPVRRKRDPALRRMAAS